MGLRTWLGLKKPPAAPSARILVEGLVQPTFPIDVIYTWVDGEDPAFCAELNRHRYGSADAESAVSDSRWTSHDELRYSLRSVQAFAPWVNHIYIVTNGQEPEWLLPHPKVSLIRHDQILESQYLPTFNSHVIGSALHKIPGLSEHYVYFNDDILLLRPMMPGDFFSENGLAWVFLSNERLPNGPVCDYDPPSVWGCKNASRLIHRQWGVWLDRRVKHTYHPQRRSVHVDNESGFAAEYHACRLNKFRSKSDIVFCSTLHGYAAHITARGFFSRNNTWYAQIRDQSVLKIYEQILGDLDTGKPRDSVCLNDTGTRHNDLPDYAERLRQFLSVYFPNPTPFESLQ
jgi:Stealth protein CR2, conserved region 2/Stealth protein CR1, conserved region 1/Stealth protein CR4, conserved region 4/Stealth protein CR3, conserved region 3